MAFELVVSGLSHRYGALPVLEDISFTIPQGEILAIVGPSGCGKSTLLAIAGGLLQPTARTVSGVCGMAPGLVVRAAGRLLDEPFSALDAQTRDLLMEDFEAIWAREQTTAAYVTHNLHEALRMADRIMILRRRPGRIREIVPVPIPRGERRGAAAERDLVRLHAELWGLIRAEAQLADREIAHA